MEKPHFKFPKIGRLSDIAYNFRGQKVTFYGTVKLHGTNASVVVDHEGNFYCQSRNRVITPENDNYGFAEWLHEEPGQQHMVEISTLSGSAKFRVNFLQYTWVI